MDDMASLSLIFTVLVVIGLGVARGSAGKVILHRPILRNL
jgi:hypothetical protein